MRTVPRHCRAAPRPGWFAGNLHLLAPTLVGLTLIGVAPAAHAEAGRSSRLYAPCVVCHAPQGWGSSDGNIPSLAGQRKSYLEKQLSAFRSAARVDTAMQVVAEHPTFQDPQNIAVLAGYLNELNANPHPALGAGNHLRVGQEVFIHICAACHGFDGAGNSANAVPRIAGQQYPYLRRQIERAAQLHLDLAPPEMTGALRSMHAQEKDALADYASRLGSSDAGIADARIDPTP